jgi:hypothetical protein
MVMSGYLLPESTPDKSSAFSRLHAGQRCVVTLKTGERFEAEWCTSMCRFKGGAHGWISRNDIDEWWPVGTPMLSGA